MPPRSFSTSAPTRPSSASLTAVDLDADQDAFFRSQITPSSPDRHPATLSFSRPPVTSNDTLAPIPERTVAPRRRRRAVAKAGIGFPAREGGESRFARKRFAAQGKEAGTSCDEKVELQLNDLKDGEGGGLATLQGMTPLEIEQAKEEVASVLSTESIAILRARGIAKQAAQSETAAPECKGKLTKITAVDTEVKENVLGAASSTSASVLKNPTRAPKEASRSDGAQLETDKQLWTTNAETEHPTQAALDTQLSAAVTALGPLASRRFNLSADVLSAEEVAALPTHLGLHHHGAEPASAGYTLPDVLLLTRSSVPSQRVVALRLLGALVQRYEEEIVAPLVEGEGLGVFGGWDEGMGRTEEIAYVKAVEAFVRERWGVEMEQLVPGLYFASRFYSGRVVGAEDEVLRILGETGCVAVLVRVARASAIRKGGNEVALRALGMVRAILTGSIEAAMKLFADETTVLSLQQLAIGLDPLQPVTSMVACDALAQAIVNTAWRGSDFVKTLELNVLNEGFLRKLATHVMWMLRDDLEQTSFHQKQAAKGVLRLFRAALCFERGIMIFTGSAQAVCQATHHDPETSTEAYLALEAYAHSLYGSVSKAEDSADTETGTTIAESGPVRVGELSEKFVMDQFSELVPMALSAARSFTYGKDNEHIRRRAAAGHFAATLLAMSTIKLHESVTVRLLNECSTASRAVRTYATDTRTNIEELQAVASLSHAGVRLLSGVKLDPAFARREIDCLMVGVEREAETLSEGRLGRPSSGWRPTANACAEWLGALSRSETTLASIRASAKLLNHLFDPQVVIDLLARCLLSARALTSMNPSISLPSARACAQGLLPQTLDALCSQVGYPVESTGGDGRKPSRLLALANIEKLLSAWIKMAVSLEPMICAASAFVKGGLIGPGKLFRLLLAAPIDIQTSLPEFMQYTLNIAKDAYNSGHPLIAKPSDTIVSSISTTPNSELVESILGLADLLVTRGPASRVEDNKSDALSSLVLSLMCGPEAEVSLREALWKKTVEACGGAILFERAKFLYTSLSPKSIEPDSIATLEVVVSRYCSTIQRGLLLSERCPAVVASIVVRCLDERLCNGKRDEVLQDLSTSVTVKHSSVARETLTRMLALADEDGVEANYLRAWFDSRACV